MEEDERLKTKSNGFDLVEDGLIKPEHLALESSEGSNNKFDVISLKKFLLNDDDYTSSNQFKEPTLLKQNLEVNKTESKNFSNVLDIPLIAIDNCNRDCHNDAKILNKTPTTSYSVIQISESEFDLSLDSNLQTTISNRNPSTVEHHKQFQISPASLQVNLLPSITEASISCLNFSIDISNTIDKSIKETEETADEESNNQKV